MELKPKFKLKLFNAKVKSKAMQENLVKLYQFYGNIFVLSQISVSRRREMKQIKLHDIK